LQLAVSAIHTLFPHHQIAHSKHVMLFLITQGSTCSFSQFVGSIAVSHCSSSDECRHSTHGPTLGKAIRKSQRCTQHQ